MVLLLTGGLGPAAALSCVWSLDNASHVEEGGREPSRGLSEPRGEIGEPESEEEEWRDY
jgi:hypothetical protein